MNRHHVLTGFIGLPKSPKMESEIFALLICGKYPSAPVTLTTNRSKVPLRTAFIDVGKSDGEALGYVEGKDEGTVVGAKDVVGNNEGALLGIALAAVL